MIEYYSDILLFLLVSLLIFLLFLFFFHDTATTEIYTLSYTTLFRSRFGEAKNKLEQYANASSKVHVEYVDMEKNPEETIAAGVHELGTVVVQIGNRTEQAKGLSEEDIAGAFIRDLKTTTRTVCFVTGSG